MRIQQFRFENKATGWQLAPLALNGFNLLVGASGVGKTLILQSLMTLRNIALGATSDGVSWEMTFQLGAHHVVWQGAFEHSGNTFQLGEIVEPAPSKEVILQDEHLIIDGQEIASRQGSTVFFQGKQLPIKLSSKTSVIKLMQEDELVGTIHSAFKNRIGETTAEPTGKYQQIVPLLVKEYTDIDAIRENNFDSLTRFALAHENAPAVFEEITDTFKAVFPRVEDLKLQLKPSTRVQVRLGNYPAVKATEIAVYFKEKDVDHWLHKDQMSSGMWKTLMVLADHHLCPNESVLLVDEFENSLGVNCIDIIGDLDTTERGLQYIMTSHHPYIINTVPISRWKIVTRHGSQVTVKPPEAFKLGRSKHEAFMQLMQLEAFTKGIAQVSAFS